MAENSTLVRALCIIIMITICAGTSTPITVQSKAGYIMGFQENVVVDGQQKTITKFLGIPFAESTAGVNKFEKPVPKAKFTGTFDARTESNTCYQGSEAHKQTLDETYNVKTTYSDDCLRLNIYVPGPVRAITSKPVLIWIHGGGFAEGSTLLYQPDGLVSYGDVIVVTVNYRLGMFGFLRDSRGYFPGNQGLWDQHLAIEWINKNIESFNGRKDNITIFGESAGSASVLFQAMYPGNRGLFQRVIAQSGTPFSFWAMTNESTSDQFIKDEGCFTADMVKCLQYKDSETFVNNNTYNFVPVIDNDFIIMPPSEIIFGNTSRSQIAREFFSSLDIIVGANDQEGFGAFVYFWKPNDDLNTTSKTFIISHTLFKNQIVPHVVTLSISVPAIEHSKDLLEELLYFTYTNWKTHMDSGALKASVIDIYNDAYIYAGVSNTITGHAALGSGRTYLYELGFDTMYHLSGLTGTEGWAHGDGIPYVFGYPLLERPDVFGKVRNFSKSEIQISKTMVTLFTNFAKTGNPNVPTPTSVRWPEYTPLSQEFLTTNSSWFMIGQYFHPQRMSLWNDIIPSVIQQSVNQQTHVECTTKTPVDEILVG